MKLRWRPHTELPPDGKVIAALLCTVDEDGTAFLLGGVFNWRRGRWLDENDDSEPTAPRFWWLPEGELLEAFPPV